MYTRVRVHTRVRTRCKDDAIPESGVTTSAHVFNAVLHSSSAAAAGDPRADEEKRERRNKTKCLPEPLRREPRRRICLRTHARTHIIHVRTRRSAVAENPSLHARADNTYSRFFACKSIGVPRRDYKILFSLCFVRSASAESVPKSELEIDTRFRRLINYHRYFGWFLILVMYIISFVLHERVHVHGNERHYHYNADESKINKPNN